MRLVRLGSIALAVLGAVALTPPAAQSQVRVFEATLSGDAESPPVVTLGSGFARLTFDLGLNTMRVEATFADLIGNTTVAHVHCCTADPGLGNVAVATAPGTFLGFPVGVTSGSYDSTYDVTLPGTWTAGFTTTFGGGTPVGALNALLTGLDEGKAYFNIHSTFAPGGEIRGFLAEVPEPATLALLSAGLLGLVAVARRRSAG